MYLVLSGRDEAGHKAVRFALRHLEPMLGGTVLEVAACIGLGAECVDLGADLPAKNPYATVGRVRCLRAAGRGDEAARVAQKYAEDLAPHSPVSQAYLAAVAGDEDAVKAAFENPSISWSNWLTSLERARMHAVMGQPEEAVR